MNIRKKFSSQIIVITIFLIFTGAGLVTGFIFQINKIKEYKSEIAILNKQIQDTKSEIKKLEKLENIDDLELDARNRLNMVKSDEIIYVDIGRR